MKTIIIIIVVILIVYFISKIFLKSFEPKFHNYKPETKILNFEKEIKK